MPRPQMSLFECAKEDALKHYGSEGQANLIRKQKERNRIKTAKSFKRVRTQFDSGRKSK